MFEIQDWKDVGVLIAAVTLLAIFVKEVFEYRWRKGNLTSRYVSEWTNKSKKLRICLESKHFQQVWFEKDQARVPDEKEFARAVTAPEVELKEAVIEFLNWCEDWAILYRDGLLKNDVADEALKTATLRYYKKIELLATAIAKYGQAEQHTPAQHWPAVFHLFKVWSGGRIAMG